MISPIESNNIMDHSYISHQGACLEKSHQTKIEAQNKGIIYHHYHCYYHYYYYYLLIIIIISIISYCYCDLSTTLTL